MHLNHFGKTVFYFKNDLSHSGMLLGIVIIVIFTYIVNDLSNDVLYFLGYVNNLIRKIS
jgi:hypothetical protein